MPYTRKTYDLFISDGLREILENIKSESVVAGLLLKRRHQKEALVSDPVNFISVSSQDPARISYLTIERMGMIESNEYWTSSRRFHAKPGGFINKLFKDISAKDVEVFSNLFRAEATKPKFNFKVVKGEDIRNYYHYTKHANDDGSLGCSCMRYDSSQKFLDVYVENTDNISLLLMLDADGYVMGRSLLWNFDGNKVMDRIYTSNDEQLPFYFKKWASENGYYFRSQQNWYNSTLFEKFSEGKKHLNLDVKLKKFEFEYYPYMDTFKFFNPNTGTFSNYRPEGKGHSTLCSADGDKYGFNYLVFDDIDKFYRHNGDVIYVDYLNINTHSNRCNYSSVMDKYILEDHSEWRDDIRDYVFTEGEYYHLNDQEAINLKVKEREEINRRKEKEREAQKNTLESFTGWASQWVTLRRRAQDNETQDGVG